MKTYVSDLIKNNYENWKNGDVVLIKAQTGQGKTYFVKDVLLNNLKWNEKILYICNRISLKRQFKIDLMKKYNISIPKLEDGQVDVEKLDKINQIKNVTIYSYQFLQSVVLNDEYSNIYQGSTTLSEEYKYIVCDECHYIFTDASFVNTTRIAYNVLIKEIMKKSIRIFISATIDLLEKCINNLYDPNKIIKYEMSTDYSYVKYNAFKYTDDIKNLILNDKTKDKWLIFVTSKIEGNKLKKDLVKENIECETIYSKSNNKELKSIVKDEKFNCKVLIATKCLDNGISIKDKELKNIVINAWDEETFIQELGRKRIEEDETINLYIPLKSKKSFTTKLYKFKDQEKKVEEYIKDKKEFNRLYDNNIKELPNNLFYRNQKNGNWELNYVGFAKLKTDIATCEYIIEEFKESKFSFIKTQLLWLGLLNKFIEDYIENVILNEEVETLETYLEKIEGEKLFIEEQQKLSDLIIAELTTISRNVDYRTKLLRHKTIEYILREQLNLNYAINKKRLDKIINGKRVRKSYIIITKIK